MRISDWSSDVCSSDLVGFGNGLERRRVAVIGLGDLQRLDRHVRNDAFGLDRTAGRRVVARGGDLDRAIIRQRQDRSEEHTSELQSLMRISSAVFCLKKKTPNNTLHAKHYQHNG